MLFKEMHIKRSRLYILYVIYDYKFIKHKNLKEKRKLNL